MLTDDQKMIRDTVRDFSRNHLAPYAAKWDSEGTFPAEALKAMAQLGLFGMMIPQQWGGAGTDTVSFVLAIEEIAAGDGACSTILSVNNSVVCAPIYQYGSDYLKQTYLRPLASGAALGCFCLTEPQAGSDASQINTTAKKRGDHYVLNGTKQFITSGKHAKVAIVFAVTSPAKGKTGISAFVVPTSNAGYEITGIEKKMGQNASDTAQIVFNDCKIPDTHLLGEAGQGYKIAMRNLESGRIGIAAQSVGMARASFEFALGYAKQRHSFGKPIMEHQAVGFRLADMATGIEAARLMTLEAARLKDEEQPCLKQACMAKLFASEVAEKVCSDAIQILGGYGYTRDFPLERIYRDVRVSKIYEGTSDIQRMLIARSLKNEY